MLLSSIWLPFFAVVVASGAVVEVGSKVSDQTDTVLSLYRKTMLYRKSNNEHEYLVMRFEYRLYQSSTMPSSLQ